MTQALRITCTIYLEALNGQKSNVTKHPINVGSGAEIVKALEIKLRLRGGGGGGRRRKIEKEVR